MIKNSLIIILSFLVFGCNLNNEVSDACGNFEAETVIVSSESSGKIIQMNVAKGQKTDTGFLSIIIDTTQISLKLNQITAQKKAVISRKEGINAQIDVFREQIKNLEVNKIRIEDMLNDGAATQKQYDDITGQIAVIDKQIANTKTRFTSITRELEVLEAQKALTADMLSRCKVKSPLEGTVLETYAEQGEFVAPGKPLYKMADLETLILKVYISGAQLSEIKTGQEVEVIIDKSATENQTFKGEVKWISPEAEFTPKIIQTKEERVKLVYAVKVNVKNDGTLKIGMPGEINWH